MREKTIEQELKDQIELINGKCLKWVSPGTSGVPDRIVLYKGNIWFVELKSPTGYLSPLQEYWGRWLTKNKFNYRVISSKEQVKQFINDIQSI